MISIIENKVEVEEVSPNQDGVNEAHDLHKDARTANRLTNSYPMCGSTYNNVEQNLLISDLICKFNSINDKVEVISQEVNNLKTSKNQPDQTDMINNFKREIYELKQENMELRERNTTLSYVMADLQTKVKDTENEKNSLITAIKLLQQDLIQPSGNQEQVDTWQTVQRKKTNVIKPATNVTRKTSDTKVTNNYVNRYEVLSDSDLEALNVNEENEEPNSPQVLPTTKQKSPSRKTIHGKPPTIKSPNKQQRNQNGRSRAVEGTITILGDSMVKMLKPLKLSRSIGARVNVKTFPGATINDMSHYVQPTLKKQPKLVVLHVGTNDIQHREPEEIAAEMKSLCQGIVSQSLSEIVISEIIKRQDPTINIKIEKTNLLLVNLCHKFKWQFIRQANIDTSNLNASGVHLNTQGTAMLAKNYIEFLKN